jgi:hypothetical protein
MNVAMQVGSMLSKNANPRAKIRIGPYGEFRPVGLKTNGRQMDEQQYKEEMAKKVSFTNLAVDSPTRTKAANSPFDPGILTGSPRSQPKFPPPKIFSQSGLLNILGRSRGDNNLP